MEPVVVLSEAVIEATVLLLRDRGMRRHEEVVYWCGFEYPTEWLIVSCVRPRATTSFGAFATSAHANAEVIAFLAAAGLRLLAQVHSHPGSFVDHSYDDDTGAFMAFENFLSIVVPHHARHGILPLSQCGVHQMRNGSFIRLSAEQSDRLLRVVPTVKDLRVR